MSNQYTYTLDDVHEVERSVMGITGIQMGALKWVDAGAGVVKGGF